MIVHSIEEKTPILDAGNKEFEDYFKALGYDVDWDHNCSGMWYELSENGKLFAQIKMVPLRDVIEDLICWHLGKPTTSKSDFWLASENEAAVARLQKRVYEKETKPIAEPDTRTPLEMARAFLSEAEEINAQNPYEESERAIDRLCGALEILIEYLERKA